MEKALHTYTLSNCATPFDMKTVPAASEEEVAAAAGRERKPSQPEGSLTTKKSDAKPTATRHDMFVEKLASIPAIADQCGPLFKSSQPAELTEAETEYMVACIKHIFPGHVVSRLGEKSRIA